MSQAEHLKKLILTHQRRLLKLKEQQAVFGAVVDPSVLIQIEDIEAELARLRAELAALPPAEEEEAGEEAAPPVTTRRPPALGTPPEAGAGEKIAPPVTTDHPLAPVTPAEVAAGEKIALPLAPSRPALAPWLAGRRTWLGSGLLVIGLTAGLVSYQMGGQLFATPTSTATAEPTPTATLTPSPEPFNPATYPTGAVTQTVTVRLWAAPGCDEPILDLEEQLRTDPDLNKLITSGEVSLDKQSAVYLTTTPSPTPTGANIQPAEPAALDIWAKCAGANSEIHFNLGPTTGPPPEVYSPSEVTIIGQRGNPLLGRNVALGLIHYQRRDYATAAKWLGSPARETDPPAKIILELLYGNSLLFQSSLQPGDYPLIYAKALEVYEKAVSENDTPFKLVMAHNNLGVALFAQGEYEMALKAFDRAIIDLQTDQPWPYFNRAYARLYNFGQKKNQEITEDCQWVVQAGKTQDDALVQAAGYTCLVEQLLLVELDENHINEIDQLLKKIETDDYPPSYALRGQFYVKSNQPDIAHYAYACYLLWIRDRVKLPIELGRIQTAQEDLKNVSQPLENLCPR